MALDASILSNIGSSLSWSTSLDHVIVLYRFLSLYRRPKVKAISPIYPPALFAKELSKMKWNFSLKF